MVITIIPIPRAGTGISASLFFSIFPSPSSRLSAGFSPTASPLCPTLFTTSATACRLGLRGISRSCSTSQYTYGYKRFSLLGAIINSIVLVVGSIYILAEAAPRLFEPQETSAPGMFLLAIMGILVNGAAVLRTRKANSINERVVSLHLLEDVLGWAAVLAGSVIMHFTGLTIIDPLLSLLIACFVLFNVYKNIKQILPVLLQGAPADVDREHIIGELREIDHVGNVHDLHIWSLDEAYNVLTVHIALTEVMPPADVIALKNEIRAVLGEENIQHATIEFETPGESCVFANCV